MISPAMLSQVLYKKSSNEGAIVLKGLPIIETAANVHMIFVLDVSDSMEDCNKLENVKQSMKFVLPFLKATDRISIVTFGEQADVKVSCLIPDVAILTSVIDSLETEGCTNLSAGLMLASGCAALDPARKVGIVLLTDGHANAGVCAPDALLDLVKNGLSQYSLTSVAYGEDHNATLLTQFAASSGGSYNIVNNLEDVATVFGEILGGLKSVVAQNIYVDFPIGTVLKTGYPYTTTDSCLKVKVGDIYSENEIVVLFSGLTEDNISVSWSDMKSFKNESYTFSSNESYTFSSIFDLESNFPRVVEIANFRFRVSSLLKDSASSALQITDAAKALVDELKALSYSGEQIIKMMLDDLSILMRRVAFGSRRVSNQMRQHAAYLDLSRGMRSSCEGESDPLNVTSPFSNLTQRSTVDTIRYTNLTPQLPSS